MRIIKDTNIQFMSQKKLGALLSGTVIILGIISLILAGGPLLSIDFKGGTLLAVHFEEPVDVNGKYYRLVCNPKGTVSKDSPESLQLLGRLFKNIQRQLKLERVGRKFFNPGKKKEYTDLKLEVWPGKIISYY